MENALPGKISVLDPVDRAIQKTKEILFRPFALKKWFIMGFCAFLANLMEGGFNFNFLSRHNQPDQTGTAYDRLNEIPGWLQTLGAGVIIAMVLGIIVLGIAFSLLFVWLSSRGKFMFLECVVQDKAEVKVPWANNREPGNSLFVFRFVLGLILLLSAALIVGVGLAISLPDILSGGFGGFAVGGIAAGAVLLLLFIFATSLIYQWVNDFIVPMMFLDRTKASEAFRRFWALFKEYPGQFLLYYLFKIVLGIAVMVIAGIACFCTCCLAVLPYIGTVILLPVFVFLRTYSLYYFSQFGEQYDVWRQPQVLMPEPPQVV
jgi:hypothetical protein